MFKTATFNRIRATKLFAYYLFFLIFNIAQTSSAQQIVSPVTAPTVQTAPVNLDFEQGTTGQVPTGWRAATQTLGYPAETTDKTPRSGTKAAVLRSEPDAKINARSFGNLMQVVDAAPYRGRRVRLRGAVRVEPGEGGGRAYLWMRVDRPENKTGFFDNMFDRPITSGEWRFYEIVGDVEEDATDLTFGMMLAGRGKAYLDDVSIEDLGKPIVVAEPPRPLSKRGLENVAAFTRLLGYVRHFHPSDEAAATDWNVFAVEGIRAVEGAKNAADLTRKLEAVFQLIAPTVSVYQTKKRPSVTGKVEQPSRHLLKMVSWKHKGFGQKISPIYQSERVYKEFPNTGQSSASPDWTKPFTADLGGGVSCVVPLALFADSTGTLPRNEAAKSFVDKKISLVKYSGKDRTTRLADVALAWNVFQHFYPYFDVVKTDWSEVLPQTLKSAATDASEKDFARTLKLMVEQLHDGHGNVIYQSNSSIGALPVVLRWIENRMVISARSKDAGDAQVGDIVVKIDGKPSLQALAETESLVSSATPQFKRFAALKSLREGANDSAVSLELQNAAGQTRIVTLRRTAAAGMLSESSLAKVEEIKPEIFYLDLDRITDEDFRAVLPKLEKAKGIVFDLRGYPNNVSPVILRHLTDKTIYSAHFTIPHITSPDRRNINYPDDNRWTLPPVAPRLTAKIAFLTDGRAISYAESYLGVVEAYKLGEIVGETTAGTNGNINPLNLMGGYRIFWTGMKVTKHDNSPHHGVGIKPTVPVSRTIRGIIEKRDEQLERAITTVSQAQ